MNSNKHVKCVCCRFRLGPFARISWRGASAPCDVVLRAPMLFFIWIMFFDELLRAVSLCTVRCHWFCCAMLSGDICTVLCRHDCLQRGLPFAFFLWHGAFPIFFGMSGVCVSHLVCTALFIFSHLLFSSFTVHVCDVFVDSRCVVRGP